MTQDEAQALAIEMGALKPHGLLERAASGPIAYNGGSFADTDVARNRLAAWTQQIMAGRDPRTGQPLR